MLINRLLEANCDVYWLKKAVTEDGQDLGTGTIWVPASANALPVLQKAAKEIGVPSYAVATAPKGEAMKLKPIRIGLYDHYGGSMPSGWTRWLFEQYEFPFTVVYPQDAGRGRSEEQVRRDRVDRRRGSPRRRGLDAEAGGGFGRGAVDPESIPEEYRDHLGTHHRREDDAGS